MPTFHREATSIEACQNSNRLVLVIYVPRSNKYLVGTFTQHARLDLCYSLLVLCRELICYSNDLCRPREWVKAIARLGMNRYRVTEEENEA